jgi:hypothetical protein
MNKCEVLSGIAKSKSGEAFFRRSRIARAIGWSLLAVSIVPAAQALEIDVGNPDVKVNWDNTVKYSAGWRLKDPSAVLVASPNADDGNRNFKKGLMSNRVDLFSEFDLSYQQIGFRVSGAAWYDQIYHDSTRHDSPMTGNASSVASNQFTGATVNLMGGMGELLDAFIYAKGDIGGTPASIRVGKHSLLYGESLFFGMNGIAGGQSPSDLNKLLGVPNSQFKELIRPQQQVSGQLQIRPNLAFGAYYQLGWERNRIPAVGSYFSTVDVLDAGGEQLLAGPPGVVFLRQEDMTPRSSGQGGFQLRFQPEGQQTEYGLYAIQFHAKNPISYLRPSGGFPTLGTYQLVFPEDIRAFGGSASTNFGDTNFGAEVSVRNNMPLVPKGGSVLVLPGQVADNGNNPAYPVGKTAHAQVSWVTPLNRSGMYDGGIFMGELAWNRLLSIDRNESLLDPNATRDASAVRVLFQPSWYQVFPGVDLNLPVGLGYGINGNSSAMHPGFSTPQGGDFSIGISGTYQQKWNFSLNYRHFFGPEANNLKSDNSFSYGQSMTDRDSVTLSVFTTF